MKEATASHEGRYFNLDAKIEERREQLKGFLKDESFHSPRERVMLDQQRWFQTRGVFLQYEGEIADRKAAVRPIFSNQRQTEHEDVDESMLASHARADKERNAARGVIEAALNDTEADPTPYKEATKTFKDLVEPLVDLQERVLERDGVMRHKRSALAHLRIATILSEIYTNHREEEAKPQNVERL